MLNKSAAIIAINDEIHSKIQDPNIKHIKEGLEALNYTIYKVSVIANIDTIIATEIEGCVKHLDIIIVLGGLGSCYSDNIFQVISRVFHQKLIYNSRLTKLLPKTEKQNVKIPMYSKVLESTCTANQIYPCVYMQGLLLTWDDPDILKLSFTKIMLPFLRNINKRPNFKRIVTLKSEEGLDKLPRRDQVDVTTNVCGNEVNISLASMSLSSLHKYEEEVLKLFGSGILRLTNNIDNNVDFIYNQINYSHIRSSIECIEECFSKYSPENIFISFNGGKDCTVLLHLTLIVLKKKYPDYKEGVFCLYVEDPDPFPQLNAFIEECRWYYGLNIVKLSKSIKESLEIILQTQPHMKACLMGTRRTDPFSENLQIFQMTDSNWPQVMRVSPLLDWHYSEIWDYLLHLKVPYCSLYDMGYTSIGSRNNSVSNPALMVYDALKNCNTYLPAYKLLDASLERNGRKQS